MRGWGWKGAGGRCLVRLRVRNHVDLVEAHDRTPDLPRRFLSAHLYLNPRITPEALQGRVVAGDGSPKGAGFGDELIGALTPHNSRKSTHTRYCVTKTLTPTQSIINPPK